MTFIISWNPGFSKCRDAHGPAFIINAHLRSYFIILKLISIFNVQKVTILTTDDITNYMYDTLNIWILFMVFVISYV